MTNPTANVIGGVDTHKHVHHAAVLATTGELLATAEFSADHGGYEELLAWMKSYGDVDAIGVEGTGFYGAALTQFLLDAGQRVIEVNRPNPSARRADGKSDRLDAEQAARAVLGKTATAVPKAKTGVVEAIRVLRVTRSSAVKARSQAFNALHGIVVGAPSPLRDELIQLTKRTLVNRCLRLRPETDQLVGLKDDADRLLLATAKTALRDLARRWKTLDEEVKELSRQIKNLVEQVAPELVELFGVGTELAGQFLVTAGDNPGRIRNEAAFAKLCGVAPQPASSGRNNGRHRLSRSGDRAANSALYTITIVRMRHHPATIEYVQRRTAEGLTKREIIRCQKRYIAREIYRSLPRTNTAQPLPRAA